MRGYVDPKKNQMQKKKDKGLLIRRDGGGTSGNCPFVSFKNPAEWGFFFQRRSSQTRRSSRIRFVESVLWTFVGGVRKIVGLSQLSERGKMGGGGGGGGGGNGK